MSAALDLVIPRWSLPDTVGACFTTRRGGASAAPWDSFNLAQHVGDDPRAVALNRARLRAELNLEHEPAWLTQVHGTTIRRLRASNGDDIENEIEADATITRARGRACVVMVADCVPVLMCSDDGQEVAAVHAGWRGLADGILGAAVDAFACRPQQLRAWLGPSIGAAAYSVGAELRERFVASDARNARHFSANDKGGWLMDLRGIAAEQLSARGLSAISVDEHCVHADRARFFSYRRDGRTGRMAALIWIKAGAEPPT